MATPAGRDHIYTWRLEDEQDTWEAQLFHRSLYRKLTAGVAEAARDLGDAGLAEQAAALAAAPPPYRLGPEHAWAVYERGFARGEDTDGRLAFARGLLDGAHEVPSAWRFRCSAARDRAGWAAHGLDRLAGQIRVDQDLDAGLTLDNVLAGPAERHVHAAKEALDLVWPEAGRNIARLVTDIVWFSAPTQESSTDPAVFGAIYMNPTHQWRVPRFVEVLLHETAHLGLNIKTLVDPMVKNREVRTESAFRTDLRPLSGSLHAGYVLVRMVYGLRLYAASRYDLPDKDDAAEIVRLIWPRLVKGVQILEDHAELTAGGRLLLDSFRDAVRELEGDRP
jgi:HEXXH motif-containing protein